MRSVTSGVHTGTEPPVWSGAKPQNTKNMLKISLNATNSILFSQNSFQRCDFGGGHVPLPLPYAPGLFLSTHDSFVYFVRNYLEATVTVENEPDIEPSVAGVERRSPGSRVDAVDRTRLSSQYTADDDVMGSCTSDDVRRRRNDGVANQVRVENMTGIQLTNHSTPV